MAKKKSPNAALIESLKPADPIPYDPELMEALFGNHQRKWQKLETLRREVYRHVMPEVWVEVLEAERAGDTEQVKALQMHADSQWHKEMGVPAITSFKNLEINMAEVAAAGYPATDAGLHAWTLAKKKSGDDEFVPAEEDIEILQALDGSPCALSLEDLGARSGHDRKKVGVRVKYLKEAGVVANPPGKQKQIGITDYGRNLLDNSQPSSP